MSKYKYIVIVLLAIYALCALCPERLLPASAAHANDARDVHDCHGGSQKEPRCPTSLVEYLPPPIESSFELRSSHPFVLQPVVAARLGLPIPVKYFCFTAAGPPLAFLKPNLRI